MMSRRSLGWVILAWTAVSWGGRIGLLTGAEAGDWLRIGGSLLVGGVVAAGMISGKFACESMLIFAVWTIPVWVRSLVIVWSETNTTAFRMIHTALALVWFGLATMALICRQRAVSDKGSSSRRGPGAKISANFDTTSSIDR